MQYLKVCIKKGRWKICCSAGPRQGCAANVLVPDTTGHSAFLSGVCADLAACGETTAYMLYLY